MYKTVLLAIDLEHDSSWRKALPTATGIADAFGAALHILTVVPDIRTSMVAQYFPDDFEEKAVREAAQNLKAFAAEHLGGRAVEVHVAAGQVYRQITAMAEKLGADMIVMASHRPELADMLIGPNADHVMRHTDASVLVVRD